MVGFSSPSNLHYNLLTKIYNGEGDEEVSIFSEEGDDAIGSIDRVHKVPRKLNSFSWELYFLISFSCDKFVSTQR